MSDQSKKTKKDPHQDKKEPPTQQTDQNGQISLLKEELQQMEAIAKRALADLQNFKRRSEEDKSQFVQFANAALLKEILHIVDNFSRAAQTIPPDLINNEWIKGVMQIQQQLENILARQGVTAMKTIGEKLNPNKHEALMQGAGEKDRILEEFEKGYLIGDRVLRHAKVKVGNGEQNS